nr:NDR1/HIN1-like protein 13 [Coffea arabica]
MADRVYPAANPAANGITTTAAVANSTFPPTKGKLYNNTTCPIYRPQSLSKRHHNCSCCCSCCLWTTLFIIFILVLVAVARAVFWVIYRAHRFNFSISPLQLSHFNLTSTGVNSKFNFTLIARNPNKKIKFFYDPINVFVLSDGVDIDDGSFPSFDHGTKNTTTLKTVISSSGQSSVRKRP